MKGKSLLAVTIAALACTQTYAIEIHKGHLLSHKEWTTKGAKAIFHSENKMTPTNQIKFPNDEQNKMHVALHALISKSTATTGLMANIPGEFSVSIHNSSLTNQTYAYYTNICTGIDDQTVQCAYTFDQFELAPNGSLKQNQIPTLQIVFNKAGNYPTFAVSQILRLDSDSEYVLSETEASSTVNVANKN